MIPSGNFPTHKCLVVVFLPPRVLACNFLSQKKIFALAYFQNKFAFSRSVSLAIQRLTNIFTAVKYRYTFSGNAVLDFIITHVPSFEFTRRIGSVMFLHLLLKITISAKRSTFCTKQEQHTATANHKIC